MNGQRHALRAHTIQYAKIVLPGGTSAFDFTVRGVTDRGALVAIENIIGIPDRFTLWIGKGSGTTRHQGPCRMARGVLAWALSQTLTELVISQQALGAGLVLLGFAGLLVTLVVWLNECRRGDN